MEQKHRLINHFKAMQQACEPLGCTATVNALTMRLELTRGTQNYSLQPQFIQIVDGKRSYGPRFTADSRIFIGWLPYFNRRWELANSKIRFKEYCQKHSIRIPEFSVSPDAKMAHVVVKSDQSSFGDSVLGPYASSAAHRLEAGEFYEAYLPGVIAKIWFWNGEPVALETQKPPYVVGNGKDTVRDLLIQQMRLGERIVINEVEKIAKGFRDYKKIQLTDVPPHGAEVPVDFRYGSPFYVRRLVEDVLFPSEKYAALEADFRRVGGLLLDSIPADIRANTAFTVDAILDAEGKASYLEMNSNPFIHPAIYAPMVKALFPPESQENAFAHRPTSGVTLQ